MAIDSKTAALFKERFAGYENPLPDNDTMAALFPMVPPRERAGNKYTYPIQGSLEHGQKHDASGTAYALATAVDAETLKAEIDGTDWSLVGQVPYSTMLRGRNGANQSGGDSAGAYWEPFDLKIDLMMQSARFYQELDLRYGPGVGSTIAADIGVVDAVISGGPNYGDGTGVVLTLTRQSWIPGIWQGAKNMLVDIMNSAGTAVSVASVSVVAVPDENKCQIKLFKTGSAVAAAAGQRLTVATAYQNSMVGAQGILQNTGTLFNIDAAANPIWNALRYDAGGGPATRQMVLAVASRLRPRYQAKKAGASFFIGGAGFAELAEEIDDQQRWVSSEEARVVSETMIEYRSGIGRIKVQCDDYMKQGLGMLFENDNGRRVGASDTTFRGDNGNDWFFLELPSNAGYQLRCIWQLALILRRPNRCAIVSNMQNAADVMPAA